MATRRMIGKNITQTQRFLQMPLEAQALYFHLIQSADDDGIVEAFPIIRMIGASDDSLGLLVVKRFVRPLNDEMVYFVIDFHEQNMVRKDRYTASRYQELLSADEMAKNPRISVFLEDENKGLTNGHPNDTQRLTNGHPSIVEGSIGKDSLVEDKGVEDRQVKSKNHTSRSLKTRLREVKKLDPINTDINKTDRARG
ncbi:hypothetical protein ACMZ6Z_06950 [Streptococcus pluranimalium]|uniref:hypothetical protein n=1 Tax=Streptococcus pluranimalium TaxID=82348 RepID=UPI0039FC3817